MHKSTFRKAEGEDLRVVIVLLYRYEWNLVELGGKEARRTALQGGVRHHGLHHASASGSKPLSDRALSRGMLSREANFPLAAAIGEIASTPSAGIVAQEHRGRAMSRKRTEQSLEGLHGLLPSGMIAQAKVLELIGDAVRRQGF